MSSSQRPVSRPMSPHLQIYKLPLPAIMSITHRMTGIFLSIGTLILTAWVVSMAMGAESYAQMNHYLGSLIGQLFLFGWTWALFYHLCNGLRHMYWDMGKGFEMKSVYLSGYITIAASVVCTLLVWIFAYI